MNMLAEELTDAEIENLFEGVVKGGTKPFLVALLLGLYGVPEPDSARRGDVAGAKILEDCAAKKIPGC